MGREGTGKGVGDDWGSVVRERRGIEGGSGNKEREFIYTVNTVNRSFKDLKVIRSICRNLYNRYCMILTLDLAVRTQSSFHDNAENFGEIHDSAVESIDGRSGALGVCRGTWWMW